MILLKFDTTESNGFYFIMKMLMTNVNRIEFGSHAWWKKSVKDSAPFSGISNMFLVFCISNFPIFFYMFRLIPFWRLLPT